MQHFDHEGFVRYKTVLYVSKAFVVEMLHYYNLLCYVECSTSLHFPIASLLHCTVCEVSSVCLISITLPPMCVCVCVWGGGVVYHRNLGAAQKIEAEIRERKVSKEYVCRVVGEFPE